MTTDAYGPVAGVALWVLRHIETITEPIETFAELNAAYPRTYMLEGIGTSLRLHPISKTKILSGTSYEYEAWKYHIRIAFIEFKRSFETIAVEIPYSIRPRLRTQCLIGLDILQHFIMTYDGPNDALSLTYKGPADAG